MKKCVFLFLAVTIQICAMQPKLSFTPHALERMEERHITKEEIAEAIKNGEVKQDGKKSIYEYKWNNEKPWEIIQVIIRKNEKSMSVVTAYRTTSKDYKEEKRAYEQDERDKELEQRIQQDLQQDEKRNKIQSQLQQRLEKKERIKEKQKELQRYNDANIDSRQKKARQIERQKERNEKWGRVAF